MNFFKTIFILVSVSITTFAQDFEGTINYTIDFKIQGDFFGLSKEDLIKAMKERGQAFDSTSIIIKDGKYRKTIYMKDKSEVIYHKSTNKLYTLTENDEFVTIQEGSKVSNVATSEKPVITDLDTLVDWEGEKLKCLSNLNVYH